MGGAASSDLQGAMLGTFLLGQALNRVFPDIYCLDDFDANLEEKRRKQKEEMRSKLQQCSTFVLEADGTLVPLSMFPNKSSQGEIDIPPQEGDVDEQDIKKQFSVDDCLVVPFKGDEIYLKLDELNKPNDDGWTPLHACCHMHAATDAALKIIDKLVETSEDLNLKTKRGPGSFASGWTPLHIACAYGIESIALKLIQCGADVEIENSVEWRPLHEAAHRGYENIVKTLLKAGAKPDVLYKPCLMAPHHPQYPLAHACRQGHDATVKALLNGGAEKDLQNEQGWCALHEAVFYRHKECVKTLIVYGCDLTLETKQRHTVNDIPTSEEIKEILKDVITPSKASPNPHSKHSTNQEPELEGKQDASETKSNEKPEFRLLGDLPDLSERGSSLTTIQFPHNDQFPQSDTENQSTSPTNENRKKKHSRRKSAKKQKAGGTIAAPEEGVPPEFACQLSGKLMNTPFTTPYGNHFERSAIEQWLSTQGNRCPVSGMPLSACEVHTDKNLLIKLNNWKLNKEEPGAQLTDEANKQLDLRQQTEENEDLYEF